MAKYGISGVWIEDNATTHYGTHEIVVTGNKKRVIEPKKTPREKVVSLLEKGHEFLTINWDYRNKVWKVGSNIEVDKDGVLKSDPNATVEDNIDHLIRYGIISKLT